MATKSPSYMTRVSQLSSVKAFARRHPGMAKAIQPFVHAEEAALDLTGKSLEDLLKLGVGDASVDWGARSDWGNDTDDEDVWLSCVGYVEYRLGVSSDGHGGFHLTYCIEDQWRGEKHVKTAKGLIQAVAKWAGA